ncbi:unnamed protein product [Haemonchus placei]|uniref:M119.5 protein n=1 Tax=Haemonchus placei TaxID=6290 RepID=A0A0N4WGE1_HAEPC|nr:unnamed protein product [Haemonchus placei]
MQTGEQVTLIFAIFTAIITLVIVIYYKFCKPKANCFRRESVSYSSLWICCHLKDSSVGFCSTYIAPMTSLPQFQTGEIITFYMLGFTFLMTVSVVVYYKYVAQNVSGRSIGGLTCRSSGRSQKSTRCEEFMDRFVRRRKS